MNNEGQVSVPCLVLTSRHFVPGILIIVDSIVKNIKSKIVATYCFPGANILDMVKESPSLLNDAKNVVIHIGSNDTTYQQSEL